MRIREAIDVINECPFWERYTEEEKIAMDIATESLELWEKLIKEIHDAPMPQGRASFFDDGKRVAVNIIREHIRRLEGMLD